jgi:hypothetical protein
MRDLHVQLHDLWRSARQRRPNGALHMDIAAQRRQNVPKRATLVSTYAL